MKLIDMNYKIELITNQYLVDAAAQKLLGCPWRPVALAGGRVGC